MQSGGGRGGAEQRALADLRSQSRRYERIAEAMVAKPVLCRLSFGVRCTAESYWSGAELNARTPPPATVRARADKGRRHMVDNTQGSDW